MGYSLKEVQKAVVAAVVAIAAGLVFVIDFDPSLTQAVVVLVGAVFGTIAVFANANSSPTDWAKTAQALQGAALSVAGYFVVVGPGTVGKIEALVTALIGVYGVYRIPNGTPIE